ncbi:MAG: hypothetical protein PVG07_00450 [Acidobacteriota bacterium]
MLSAGTRFAASSKCSVALMIVVTLAVPQLAAAAVEQGDPAEVLVGEVTVQSLSDGRIAVVVNRFDAGDPDQTAERVFVLQTEGPVATDLPIRMEAGRVVAKRDRLLILSLEEPRAVGLFLSGVDRAEVAEFLEAMLVHRYGAADPSRIFTVSGYGLSDHRGEYALPLESWPPGGAAMRPVPKGLPVKLRLQPTRAATSKRRELRAGASPSPLEGGKGIEGLWGGSRGSSRWIGAAFPRDRANLTQSSRARPL